MSELTEEEHQEIVRRAERLHHLFADPGGAYPIGDFVVDCAHGIGIWAYDYRKGHQELIYNNSPTYPHDTNRVRELLDLLRRAMVLDDLADV